MTTRSVYAGSNILFRSADLGESWEEISPDLTYAIRPGHAHAHGGRGGRRPDVAKTMANPAMAT